MWIVFVVLGVALAMMVFERARPGRALPTVRGWWGRVALLNLGQAAVVWLAGVSWEPWLAVNRPWSVPALGTLGGAAIGYLAITFVYYGWHRARHEVPLLWRWFHQVHHSPQRIEVVTSFYKHPFEVVANGVLSSAILYLGVGLGPEAATLAVLATGVAELFYHWNVRTPRALGPFFQRPEMHCVHHEEGRHSSNYSDLPLWDILFGTYHNPERFEGRCGLGADAEQRLGDMLRGRDVSAARRVTHSEATQRGLGRAGALVLALGLAQMGAAALGAPRTQAVLAATGASPAPKVFSTARGLETYSSRFELEIGDRGGGSHRIALTPERYASISGPYARRNAYGAALAYGPVLATDPHMRALFEEVGRFGLCGEAPLLRELGVDPDQVAWTRLHVQPKEGTSPDPALTLEIEPACAR